MKRGSAAEPTWEQLLARTPFAAALAQGAPLWIARGESPQAVFATPAALAALDVSDLAAFGRAVLSDEAPSGRRLRKLAAETPPDGPPRLERMRFFVDRKPVARDWLCARLSRDGESYFVAAEATAAESATAGGGSEGAPDTPAQRFVWRLDSDNRFGAPDPVALSRLGASAPHDGETLDALGERVGLDSAFADAVATRATFSRVRALWPTPDRDAALVTQLSGSPAFGPGDCYEGFRGFGLLTGERVASAPSAPSAPRPAGDAAALIRLLQRQHAPATLAVPSSGAANAPALAVISALAALLQPKASREGKPSNEAKPSNETKLSNETKTSSETRPGRRAPTANGAEIVVLHPQAGLPSPAAEESVELTSQERDNFKAIARALGANVRGRGPATDTPADIQAYSETHTPAERHQESDGDFAALLDLLPIAVLVVRETETLYANKTLLDLTGYPDLEAFRDRDGLKEIFRGRDPRVLAQGGSVEAAPLVTLGGRILTVDAQVRDATWGGQPAELVSLRRSYEAERQEEMRAMEREADLHAARARDFSVALEAARDGMLKLDRSGRILSMNKSAQRLFDRHQNEAAGESLLTLFPPSAHAATQGALDRMVNGEASAERLEVEARAADGRVFPAQIDLGRLAGEHDPEYFLLLTDLSGVENGAAQAHAAREESEKDSIAKTELLSRVSHEMRTPLHAILGFAEVMLEERFGPMGNERYRDYIRDIHASGRHVLSLTDDLLDLSRIELGKMDLQFTPLDVNVVVRACVMLMQPQAARERVIMRLSLFDRLPNVMADERSLRQILLNLMANAVKYNEPGGQVIVSTALDDAGSVILRVRDTGVGMNDSELAIALEPFRRVPGAKGSDGAGIGLPLTKALVEANHADFSIKSRKDQGTLVEIAFPVPRAAQ
jgi:PAS domain S-box-containing protein